MLYQNLYVWKHQRVTKSKERVHVCVCVCACMRVGRACVCVCVCVRAWEREQEREITNMHNCRLWLQITFFLSAHWLYKTHLQMCVCSCVCVCVCVCVFVCVCVCVQMLKPDAFLQTAGAWDSDRERTHTRLSCTHSPKHTHAQQYIISQVEQVTFCAVW